MGWFRRRQHEDLVVKPTPQSRVEVELHKSANREAADKAKDVNAHLKDLLQQNGFTLKIYLAAGHQYPPQKK